MAILSFENGTRIGGSLWLFPVEGERYLSIRILKVERKRSRRRRRER